MIGSTQTGVFAITGALSIFLSSSIAHGQVFTESFDGQPNSPETFISPDWDIAIFTRDIYTWYEPKAGMLADHGPNCEGPPVQHPITRLEDVVFKCKDHMMTSINDDALGRVTLTPDHMIDFSHSDGIIEFDLSTFRRGGYDWLEFFITPFEDNLVHPSQPFWDVAGPPDNAIAIELVPGGINRFNLTVFKDGEVVENPVCGSNCPGDRTWVSYDSPDLPLVPSQRRRDKFRITLNENEISFSVSGYYDGQDLDNEFYFLEKVPLPELGWSRGVVQLSHVVFDPTNNCANVPTPVNPPDNPPGFDIQCEADTWHWDNIRIEPAVPFTIIPTVRQNPGDTYKQRYADDANNRVRFTQASSEGSFLRFSAIGANIEVSLDGGTSWAPARLQPQLEFVDFRFNNYFHPMPEGVEEVWFRGGTWWGGSWHARDISIWSQDPDRPVALPGTALSN